MEDVNVEHVKKKPPDLLFVKPYSPATQEVQEDQMEYTRMEYIFLYNSCSLALAHRTGGKSG